ncbi:RagB/SusD family nutrient uptake outer membrane protein [Marinoscillum furvescens]|uniref:Putative outer membrane starch-binding protein n=1 Tax=Marinoscillum furvescens DSM 4134 TaxID=1122208 RepID=A0A3D9L2U4_MARFU|nr:RagB/SusD family nutrient uptake outer membrane protein [Marinoscillum furvescens]RED97012.1 putative outer membrane starch-binding protein [Marinoscillum furvescens DSM 4134]
MKNIIVLILVAVVMLTSCDDDFLEVESPNLTDQAVWQDATLAEAFVLGLYTSIRIADKEPGHNGGDTPGGFGRGFHWALFSSVSDETIYSNDDATYLVQRGQMSPSNFGFMSTTWGRSYRGIREVNLALSKVDVPESPFEEDIKNRLIGELHFIRAFRYFDLLKGFGPVPIMGDRVTSLEDADFSELFDRRPIQEVVDYIVAELDLAIANLPADNGARATSGAAMALKSRVLLYAASPLYTETDDPAKWQAAATAAEEVISLGKYQLVTDLRSDPAENFQQYFLNRTATSEDIFMRFYVEESSSGGRAIPIERMNGPNGSGGWGGNCPMQNFVDDFEMDNGLPITDPASGYDDQDPYSNRDPRFYASVVYNGGMIRDRAYESFTPGGADSPDGNEPWNTSPTGYLMRKFMREDISLNSWNQMGTTPWRYFRYAEILLNFAEAQNELAGPNSTGSTGYTPYAAVNEVRARAGMPALPAGLDKAAFRERLRNERRVELAFEEHRYFDVRRWKIAETVENQPARRVTITKESDGSLTYSYDQEALSGKQFEQQHYWFPIPLEEISASDGMLDQNPFY